MICAAKAVLGARVEKSKAESLRRELSAGRLVEKTLAIVDDEDHVVIPLTSQPPRDLLTVRSATIVDWTFPTRRHTRDPIDIIVETAPVPGPLVQSLPRKWELFGEVLVLRLDMSLDSYEEPIAKSYASVLGAKTVLREIGGISGEFRRPVLKKIMAALNDYYGLTIYIAGVHLNVAVFLKSVELSVLCSFIKKRNFHQLLGAIATAKTSQSASPMEELLVRSSGDTPVST